MTVNLCCITETTSESEPHIGQRNRRDEMAKKIVNIRLRPDQEARINAIVERSAILDTSKFVRIAVDWLLRSDIGEVIKTIVHDQEAFPEYQIPKKAAGRTKGRQKRRTGRAE
jgi:hypothetical protein